MSEYVYLNYTVCKLYSSSFLFYSQKRAGILDHTYSRPSPCIPPPLSHLETLQSLLIISFCSNQLSLVHKLSCYED